MALSDAGLKDPSMLGSSAYARNPLDYYPTPKSAIDSFLDIYEEDVPPMQFWEPFAGNGAIYNPISELARNSLATDIHAYEGFDSRRLIDFFSIVPDDEYDAEYTRWHDTPDESSPPWPPVPFCEIANTAGFRPDAIITNPPYGKLAEKAARHALRLMMAEKGFVAFLCRNEWDCAKGRSDLFDHPAFAAKVVLRHRPRWIAGSDGAPRHSYAWFCFDWTKAIAAPGVKPELLYAR